MPSPPHMPPARPGRDGTLASRIARRIEADIVERGWPVGSVLGSQLELLRRYHVSRDSLTEAIRIVEHHGAGFMRRGPSGGLVVSAPDGTAVTTAISMYLDHVGCTAEDVTGGRLLLEPAAAALAAETITEDGIVRLRAAAGSDPGSPPGHGAPDAGTLTRAITASSGNTVLGALLEVLSQRTPQPAASQDSDLPRRLVEAIVGGDAPAARRLAEQHVQLRGSGPYLARPAGPASPGRPDGKLAEVVARRIRADIICGGWPVGEIVGSESELVRRHDVSRSVLREAVTLLEHHSVAWMQRGRGGGLKVTSPDPAASVEAMALFLSYQGASADELGAVRQIIEPHCLRLLAASRGEADLAVKVAASLRSQAGLAIDDFMAGAFHAHLVLADLTGSTILPLFLRIVIALQALRAAMRPVTARLDQASLRSSLAAFHARIADALEDGDWNLAERRLRQHLEHGRAWGNAQTGAG